MIFNSNVGSLLNPGSGGYGAAFEKAVMHGIVRAGMAKLQGQKVSAGFWSGFVASGFAAPKSWGIKEGTFVNAVVGGTTSELTGGKFANGAVTGAFVHLFNAEGGLYKPSKSPFKSILLNGTKRAYQGGIAGAALGATFDEGLGALAGGALGGTFGFAGGLIEGTAKEALSITYYIQQTLNSSKELFVNSLENANYLPNNSAYKIDSDHWIVP